MSKCLKCQKEYIPKRRGGKFCSTSCRVAYHQRVQRGFAIPNPPTGDEVYLANKLMLAGKLGRELEAQLALPKEQRRTDLLNKIKELASFCSTFTNIGIVERIIERDSQERRADYDAYRARTGLY